MSSKSQDIKAQVEARVEKEQELLAKAQKTPEVAALELPDSFIIDCLHANRVGDATLYNTLFRGKYVYHKRWGRWLKWAGHHWQEDLLDTAEARIEQVCHLYLRIAEKAQAEADEEDDKEIKRLHQDRVDSAFRRVNNLRDTRGRESLLKLAHRIEEPLAIVGDELDQKPYKLACPNCVIDLRTGDSYPGHPLDYLLASSPTSWEGLDEPCPTFESQHGR